MSKLNRETETTQIPYEIRSPDDGRFPTNNVWQSIGGAPAHSPSRSVADDTFDEELDVPPNRVPLDAPSGVPEAGAAGELMSDGLPIGMDVASQRDEDEADGTPRERVPPGSGASAGGAGPNAERGPLKISASKLSYRFTDGLLTSGRRVECYSVTFTERTGKRSKVERHARRFIKQLLRSYPAAGAILAADRGPQHGHWHIHGVVFLPTPPRSRSTTARIAEESERMRRLRLIWLRLWPRKAGGRRPFLGAQKVRPIASTNGTRRALAGALAHALDRHAEREARARGNTTFKMPNLLDRALICGDWARALFDAAINKKRKPTKPRELRRVTGCRGERCGWCGNSLTNESGEKMRADCKYHPACARRARRAMDLAVSRLQPLVPVWVATLERRALYGRPVRDGFDLDAYMAHDVGDEGWHVRTWVDKLERAGWVRLDALRAVEALIDGGAWPTLHPLSHPSFAEVLDCACGRPLARRTNAVTCGAARCRGVARRRRSGGAR